MCQSESSLRELLIVPTELNTVGALSQAYQDGFRAFSITVQAGKKHNKGKLYIVNQQSLPTRYTLDQLLAQSSYFNWENIWLNITNLSSANLHEVSGQLTEILGRFPSVKQIYITSNTKPETLGRINIQGITPVYAVSSKKTLSVTTKNPTTEAHRLAAKLNTSKVDTITFQSNDYDFIKRYLEQQIDNKLTYIVEENISTLYQQNLVKTLSSQPYYQDIQVQAILIPYKADYRF